MSENITKVQGIVIDLENNGGGGGNGGIIRPVPELIEKFEIGDTWITSKSAESYYNPEYIASLDLPHPVTSGVFYDKYKIEIPIENRISVKKNLRIHASSDTAAGYHGKVVSIPQEEGAYIATYTDQIVHVSASGVYTTLFDMNDTYSQIDFEFFDDAETGIRTFYFPFKGKLYKTDDFSTTVRVDENVFYDYHETFHFAQFYKEGNSLYLVTSTDNTFVTKCLFFEHNNDTVDPFFIWSNLSLLDYRQGSGGTSYFRGFIRLQDELIFNGGSTDYPDGALHKLNIKSGFVTEGFISKEFIKVMLDGTDFFNDSEITFTNGKSVAYIKNVGILAKDTSLYIDFRAKEVGDNSTDYFSLSFSRERGFEIRKRSSGAMYGTYYIGQKDFVYSNNTSVVNLVQETEMDHDALVLTLPLYVDGFLFLKRDYAFSAVFYGNAEDSSKYYAIAKEETTSDYYIVEIGLTEGGYFSPAYIPAMTSLGTDLQYYMRIK